jgi:hypothetical protein
LSALLLSWHSDGEISLAELAGDGRTVVGRSAEADVVIDESTVSRRHAAVLVRAGTGAIENLSATNPTRLNGVPLAGSAKLADGDVMTVGNVALTFHDLAARDRRSGPVCHVCRRENDPADHDCWYCGTSLLNAPTTIRESRPVICRVLAEGGSWADLYAGRALVLKPDGTIESTPQQRIPAEAARLEERDGKALYVPGAGASAEELHTGSKLSVQGANFSVICRSEHGA